ncbi:MAG: hypothetical protein AUH11_20255 [Acidobacteria bacterium 13_2_20CM_57_17]|nr:MAG: hypothetical protein AUH11_20255 [Acidobacteria bacterium 13_2_20CM_57_17]OLB91068.1 MAG: hypothetical protein AUI02_10340 [Acidobacteria bacterium 13_2_20CM_2_57_12]OLE17124.1 MAG: hypothetical protein AUG83_00320 [Acidobacteria bacterium 13_1_20CM_4_57_11]
MIEFIFTLDYEIYGDGTGTLRELVYEPAEQLQTLFRKWNAQFVAFIEVAELEKIETYETDQAIHLVKKQIQDLYRNNHEIALHLHPQWCNARRKQDKWVLDYGEYNLCVLPRKRISEIVDRSLHYLRKVVGQPEFTPLSFRAGNWLFQPTETAASVLAENGIQIDSSVFKGGLQHNHTLDYRRASRNGYYWKFSSDVNQSDARGSWMEVPIYTEMVPLWRVPTTKRMGFARGLGIHGQGFMQKLNRGRDLLRFSYPMKLDFCRMNLRELTAMVHRIIQKDRQDPSSYKPIVAIGHTKDLTDSQTVDDFLAFLRANKITISTFEIAYSQMLSEMSQAPCLSSMRGQRIERDRMCLRNRQSL